MVRVKPHSYTLDTVSGFVPLGLRGGHSVLDLYLIGDAKTGKESGWGPSGESWILDDRGHKTAHEVLYGPRRREADVPASAQTVKRWTQAMRDAQNALHDAELQYLKDLGYVATRTGNGRTLARAPGWKGWLRQLHWRRGHQASAAYRKRTEHIRELYAPVGDEIEALVLKRERQWMRAQKVGMEARWRYSVDQGNGVTHVVYDSDAPLDTETLARELLQIRRDTEVAELRWSDASRAEIERRSGVDFDTWWEWITQSSWGTARRIPSNMLSDQGFAVLSGTLNVEYRLITRM
jgi:hypothetical protein